MKVNGVEVDVHDYDSYSAMTHMKTNKRISSYESRMEAHEAEKSGAKPKANMIKVIIWIIVLFNFGPQVLILLFGVFFGILEALGM